MVVMNWRPSAVTCVSVRPTASKIVRDTDPPMMSESVCWVRLSGSCRLDRVLIRELRPENVSPLGKVIEKRLSPGACKPDRGSRAIVIDVVVPSGVVLRVVPSALSSVTVMMPSGPMIERRVVPVGRLEIEYELSRLIWDKVETVTLVSDTDRTRLVNPPAGSLSRFSRPTESYEN